MPCAKDDEVSPRLRDSKAAVEHRTRQATWPRRFSPSGQARVLNQERRCRCLGDLAVRT